eukprot:2567110-Pyramimonas_sp.AAC.1
MLALHSCILRSKHALTNQLEKDMVLFLEGITQEAQPSVDGGMARQAWQRYHKLLRFGGRNKKPTALPCMLDNQGNPLASSDLVAQHTQEFFG